MRVQTNKILIHRSAKRVWSDVYSDIDHEIPRSEIKGYQSKATKDVEAKLLGEVSKITTRPFTAVSKLAY